MSLPDPAKTPKDASLRLSRRGAIIFGMAGLATAGGVAAQWFNILGDNLGENALDPEAAHTASRAGDILLIDIRRPDEWQSTGIGQHALPIDMRRADFETELLNAALGDTARPIALICARGVRSRRLSARLQAAGFTRIIDVPEGMLGSGAGPGWLKRGLPVVTPG